jgi:hypothetical protein
VFGAWLNHDDSRGVNSLDMLEPSKNGSAIKHYMFDFGSIMGSGTVFAQRHRPGNEYILEWKPGWLTLATLGLYVRPWTRIDYPDVPPSVGRFESDAFDPEQWKPEYPNAAFDNMRPDDAFWAARIVSRFDANTVRAIVEKARFTDPSATEYLTRTLMRRREKVLHAWLTKVNPLADFVVSNTSEFSFQNAAEIEGLVTPAREYRIQWARFDNASGISSDIDESVVREPRVALPESFRGASAPEFFEARVSAIHPDFPSWSRPVIVHFRRSGSEWKLVGLTRMPD